MHRIKPLSTSTFRLTLAYLGLFSLSAAIILAVVYIVGARFVDRQLRDDRARGAIVHRQRRDGTKGLRACRHGRDHTESAPGSAMGRWHDRPTPLSVATGCR